MKQLLPISFLFIVSFFAGAQDSARALPSFNKIIVSPRISLILIKGDNESIRLICNNVSPNHVNVKVHGGKLRIFLDHARALEKQVRRDDDYHHGKTGIYNNVTVTAYVTYKSLKALEIRGQGELSASDPIVAEKLKLRVFGECEIDLASVTAQKFKASLYGESKLRIRGGEVNREVFRVFGEARVDMKGVLCATASVRLYGEGKLSINATDEVHVSALGENAVDVFGTAIVNRGITIGRTSVNRN